MRSIGRPIKAVDVTERHDLVVDGWFDTATERFKMYSGAAAPTIDQVPQGEWVVYKNTTLNEVRIWVNDGGTMKKSAAFS